MPPDTPPLSFVSVPALRSFPPDQDLPRHLFHCPPSPLAATATVTDTDTILGAGAGAGSGWSGEDARFSELHKQYQLLLSHERQGVNIERKIWASEKELFTNRIVDLEGSVRKLRVEVGELRRKGEERVVGEREEREEDEFVAAGSGSGGGSGDFGKETEQSHIEAKEDEDDEEEEDNHHHHHDSGGGESEEVVKESSSAIELESEDDHEQDRKESKQPARPSLRAAYRKSFDASTYVPPDQADISALLMMNEARRIIASRPAANFASQWGTNNNNNDKGGHGDRYRRGDVDDDDDDDDDGYGNDEEDIPLVLKKTTNFGGGFGSYAF